MSNKQVYRFRKGQITHLDHIYKIQGLAGGDWWEKTGGDVSMPDYMGLGMGDEIIITRDIEITIIVATPGEAQ